MIPSKLPPVWVEFRENRNRKLKSKIAKDNDKLVYKVANRWAGQCPEPVEDLAQIGRIGLLKAIDRYDPDHDAAFSSFAVPYINGAILHHLRDHWGSVKIPRTAFEKAGKVKRLQRKMEALGRPVSMIAAARAAGFSDQHWQWVSEAVQRKQLATIDEIPEIPDDSYCESDDSRADYYRSLMSNLAMLSSQGRRALTAKFFKGQSDSVTAKELGCTIDELNTLIESALSQLRDKLETSHAHR